MRYFYKEIAKILRIRNRNSNTDIYSEEFKLQLAYNDIYMCEAIELAQKSYEIGDVPVGAVIVDINQETGEGRVIGRGYNRKEQERNALLHAEIIAINDAYNTIGDWRLNKAVMYVTCEPCIMCCGAILHSRLKHVYFGSPEPRYGGVVTKEHILDNTTLNHKTSYSYGYKRDEVAELMKSFFLKVRQDKKVIKSEQSDVDDNCCDNAKNDEDNDIDSTR